MAEAGTGKSRLFFEFKATHQSGWMVLETFSVSHGKASAYLPVLDLLHGYFKIAGGDDERTRREKVAGKIAILDRSLEDTLPYLFGLLGIVEGDDPLAQMDGQIEEAAHARGDQTHRAARIAQSAADGDLRGLALDRRGDAGVPESARRLDRHREDSAAGELPSRILTSVGQQDLLYAVAARPTRQGERRGDALGAARRRRRSRAAQAADHREDRRQSVLHGRDGAGAVRRGRAGARRRGGEAYASH